MKKRLICTIMILNLIFVPCYQSYADAGTLTVAGGTIGIGGLSAGALAGLAGPAVVAVFCGMLAVGMDIELTQASQQAGMTKTEFLKSKINQYCQEANTTANVFYKGIADNMKITKNGAIELGNQASTQIKQFINWLYNSNQVSSGSGSLDFSGSYVTINGMNFPVLHPGESIALNDINEILLINSAQNNKSVAIMRKSNNNFALFTPSSERIDLNINVTNYYTNINTTLDIVSNGFAWGYFTAVTCNNMNIPTVDTFDGFIDSITSVDVSNDGFTGDRDEWNDKSGALDPSQDMPTVINPGLIGQIPIPADTDITVNVRDYLDALQDVLDGIQDKIITGRDDADGIPKDWDIPDEVVIDPTIGKDDPVPDDDSTPVTDDKPVDPATEPNLATEPLKFNLTNIFPFCIPFDIKDMLGLLQAEPIAPRYTVDWDLPFVDQNFTFTVDLSGWSNVAYILRKMEILAFVIGLALVTRNLIRG